MNPKLYVGNLPYDTTDQLLSDHFAQAGTVVSAVIISDRHSGRSKGFGFVEMSTPEEAQKAIEMFHEQDFGGRTIVVNEARPKPDAAGGDTMSRPAQAPQMSQNDDSQDMSETETSADVAIDSSSDMSQDVATDMSEDATEKTPVEESQKD